MNLNEVLQNLVTNRKVTINEANEFSAKLNAANTQINEYNGAIALTQSLIEQEKKENEEDSKIETSNCTLVK